MRKTTYPEDKEDVELLLGVAKGLSSWELDFVESLDLQVINDCCELTPKQRKKLDEILAENDL